jgi:HEAT repeat protein
MAATSPTAGAALTRGPADTTMMTGPVHEAETRRWRAVPESLVVLLGSPHGADRRLAVELLGRQADAPAVEILSSCLADPDVDVIYDAALVLAKIGSPASIEALVALATDHAGTVVRRVIAASALGDARPPPAPAVEALRRLASNADRWLQEEARLSLGRLTRG